MKKDKTKKSFQPDFKKAAKEINSDDFDIDTLLENFLLNFQVDDFANTVNTLFSIFQNKDTEKAFVEAMKSYDSSKED